MVRYGTSGSIYRVGRSREREPFKSARGLPARMNPGDRVRVDRGVATYEGVLMPSSTAEHLVVKLEGGYNVGVDRADADVEVLESGTYDVEGARETADDAVDGAAVGDDVAGDGPEGDGAVGDDAASEITFDDDLPTVALISTGGTIASTVDYRTGAVTAQFDAEDVLRAVPALAGRANYRGRVVANILSENMTPEVWVDLAEAVHEEIDRGADGVVVMHGTDTMQYTASALSFMLDTPVPVVFTGSQRSADRPSSDNVMNAVCAVEAATADHSEVLVCMHATESDDRCALHRATRVRKNHTSRRDAFETVGAQPIGEVDWETGTVSFRRAVADRDAVDLDLSASLEGDVAFQKFVPGTPVDALDRADGAAGLVLEGTGLGHVHTDWIDRIGELVDDGTVVVMTSQCLEGRVCDRVYDTGRDLLEAGVVEAGDTLPGTAYVKLMWALANVENVEETMRRSIAGELQERSVPWT